MSMNLYERIPNNVNLSERQTSSARAGKVAAELSRLVARDGAGRFSGQGCVPAHGHRRRA